MPLSLAELQKAQAETEGFQNGPHPALNPANLNTQDALGNTQIPTTSPVPYYPSDETPNLQLSTEDMSSTIANNFVILDRFIAEKFQTKRVSYLVTLADAAQGWAQVDVVWDTPFLDTNYTVVFAVGDTTGVVGLNFFTGDFHFKTAQGCSFIVRTFSPGSGGDGETVIVNAVAIHD